jgi:hypothetical protein
VVVSNESLNVGFPTAIENMNSTIVLTDIVVPSQKFIQILILVMVAYLVFRSLLFDIWDLNRSFKVLVKKPITNVVLRISNGNNTIDIFLMTCYLFNNNHRLIQAILRLCQPSTAHLAMRIFFNMSRTSSTEYFMQNNAFKPKFEL